MCGFIARPHRTWTPPSARGRFREDLFYRLNVFPVLMPRCASGSRDLPVLIEHLWQRQEQWRAGTLIGQQA